MTKDNFIDWSKEELVKEIKKLKKRKKYGIVWEEKNEQVVELCKEKLPILIEDEERNISSTKEKPVNVLIEGDNYHALSVLNYTPQRKDRRHLHRPSIQHRNRRIHIQRQNS